MSEHKYVYTYMYDKCWPGMMYEEWTRIKSNDDDDDDVMLLMLEYIKMKIKSI